MKSAIEQEIEWLRFEKAVEHTLAPDGGSRPDFVAMVNSLSNMLIDAASKGYVSSNDLDYANDCLDKIIPLL